MAKNVTVTPADGDIQFQNTSGTDAGRIAQDGDNLVITNAVGDILFGDTNADVYIGDGVNSVDVLFEQSGAIKADANSQGVTLTIGGAETDLQLYAPSMSNLSAQGSESTTLMINTNGEVGTRELGSMAFEATSSYLSSSDVVFVLNGNDIEAGDGISLAGGLSYNATTNTLSQADNNTTYSAGTGLTLTNTTFSVTANTYAAASHNHDDRYYTETESDARYARGVTKSYSSVDTASDVDSWYKFFTITDSGSTPVICFLRGYAHSSVSFIVSEGYQGGNAHVQILDYLTSTNNNYKWIKGVRVISNGDVEVLLNGGATVSLEMTIIGDASYVSTPALSSASASDVKDSVTNLTNGMLRAKGTISGGNTSNWDTAYTHSQAAHAPSNAEQNVQSDWNETTTTSDAFIKNKPTLGTASASAATDFVAVTGDSMSGVLSVNYNGIGLEVGNSANSGADTGVRIRGARNGQSYSTGNLTSYILLSNFDDNTTPNNYDLVKIGGGMYDANSDTGFLRIETNNGTALTKALDIDKNQDAKFYGDVDADGNITASNLNVSNWDTAYGWGNHDSAGYLKTETYTGTVTSVTVGTGLDVATGTTTPNITLDLSELTDMTAAINTSQDELILLDNGAERRKLFSEIFGSAAYSNTSAFAAASHNHDSSYPAKSDSYISLFSDSWQSTVSAKYVTISLPYMTGSGASGYYIFDVFGYRDIASMDSLVNYRVYAHVRSDGTEENNVNFHVYTLHEAATEEFEFAYKINAGSTTSVYIYIEEDYSGLEIFGIPVTEGSLNLTTSGMISISGTAPTGTTQIVRQVAHPRVNATAGTYGDTANGQKIDTITIDEHGHVTAVATGATGNMTGFFVEDGDGTEVQINNANEWKFVEGTGIDINWTDTDNGTDTDPYDLTFGIKDNSIGITQLNVTDGTSGQVLTTNGSGTLSFATVASGSDTNYYLDGIARTDSTNTLVFSVSGATNQSYTFGSNAFTSYTDHTEAGYLTSETYTAHEDTSNLSGTYGSVANGTKIDEITVDANGHITAITTGATGNMTGFYVEDGDGTEVQINNANEWKFVEGGGIDINWTDTSTGSDTDPYDLTFTLDSDLRGNVVYIGGNANNYIQFDTTNNRIDFYAGNVFVARMESDGDLHIKGDIIAFSSIFA